MSSESKNRNSDDVSEVLHNDTPLATCYEPVTWSWTLEQFEAERAYLEWCKKSGLLTGRTKTTNPGKTRIDINEVKQLKARLREINKLDLASIEWVDVDKVLEIPADVVEEWRFMGMNNADFIDTEFYLGIPEGWEELMKENETLEGPSRAQRT